MNKDIVTYLQNRTVFIISLPIKTAMVLLKVSWRSLRRCMSILAFLWSAFLTLFALNFQPRFHVKLIFTLTTVKNIAITQNAVYHNLKPGTTKSKEGALMYQNPLSNPFFVLWVVQSGPSSRTIGKELTRLHKSSYPGESFFESCTIAAWFWFH